MRRLLRPSLVGAVVTGVAVAGVLVLAADDERSVVRVASESPGEDAPDSEGREGFAVPDPNAARVLVPTYLPEGFALRRNDVTNVQLPGGPGAYHFAHYDDGSGVAPDQAEPGEAARPAHAEVIVNVITGPPPAQDELDRMASEAGARRIRLRGRTAVIVAGAPSDGAEAARVPSVTQQVALKWVEADGVTVFMSAKNVAEAEVLRIAEGLVPE